MIGADLINNLKQQQCHLSYCSYSHLWWSIMSLLFCIHTEFMAITKSYSCNSMWGICIMTQNKINNITINRTSLDNNFLRDKELMQIRGNNHLWEDLYKSPYLKIQIKIIKILSTRMYTFNHRDLQTCLISHHKLFMVNP